MPHDRTGQPWTREETLTAFVLYMHLPRGLFHARNKDIIALAKAMGRPPSSVARKLSNIEHFDPNRPANVVGSSNGSHWERDLWNEMSEKGDSLVAEAVGLYQTTMTPMASIDYQGSPVLTDIVEGRDVTVQSTKRLNQDYFRKSLLDLYEGRCCVTGLNVEQLLVASHIKPWRDADPLTERVNVENGLLLNCLHDAAFDRGLITLDHNYCIRMSQQLEKRVLAENNEGLNWLWSTKGRRIHLPKAHRPSKDFITYHQDVVFLG